MIQSQPNKTLFVACYTEYTLYSIHQCTPRTTVFRVFFVTVQTIDPLSEGLVTPPLVVEKLSPRLSFFIICFLA